MNTNEAEHQFVPKGEAVALLPVPGSQCKPVVVIGTPEIRRGFDPTCLKQALATRAAPGVAELVLQPDAHAGYGAPIGCVLASPTHIYPGPIGVDIKCSMSLLQLDLPADAISARPIRRAIIDAICKRIPTGPGKGARAVAMGREVSEELGMQALTEGASQAVLSELGIPVEWASRCEDAHHVGHDGTQAALRHRIVALLKAGVIKNFAEKCNQLGSYGGGNHFGECGTVAIEDSARARDVAAHFGLKDGHVAFLSHCGSRGLGNILARNQFQLLKRHFEQWNIPLPGNDRELVYAPLGSPEANDYLDDMALGANFATVNHMLINARVLDAFREVIPGTTGRLVYFISHNIARREEVGGLEMWVHRKGATRAFPAGHPALRGSPFEGVGHPILLPGNPRDGSVVMVAEEGARMSCYSVNHGAGRAMGRRAAFKALDQAAVDAELDKLDVLSNCRAYPLDEAPAAYKDFREVLKSVELAGLASVVARLKPRFVIKDAAESDG
jgi:tRNA-splicing ligase RtcB